MDDLLHPEHPAWDALEERIAYRFADRGLLLEAMTHRSYANEMTSREIPDYERFEFLGDAVLDLVVSRCLLRDFPGCNEGELTRLRAEVVAEGSLARLAGSLRLGEALLLGRGEERSGGRRKTSLLADAIEALFGAIFTDGGFERAAEVIEPLLLPLVAAASQRSGHDFKTRLQEACQARQQTLPIYRLAEASGPDHERQYRVEVYLETRLCGTGIGSTKKKAEQDAARQALRTLSA